MYLSGVRQLHRGSQHSVSTRAGNELPRNAGTEPGIFYCSGDDSRGPCEEEEEESLPLVSSCTIDCLCDDGQARTVLWVVLVVTAYNHRFPPSAHSFFSLARLPNFPARL
jgi:hypothetical protein